MIPFARAALVALTLVAICACNQRRLAKCQQFTRELAESGSAIMHHPLKNPHFETVLTRVDSRIASLDGIAQLEQAKADYKTKMSKAISLAAKANGTERPPARIDANATARAQAANATYHFMEATNLHCMGER